MISEQDLAADPVEQFQNWYQQALSSQLETGVDRKSGFIFYLFSRLHIFLQKWLNYGSAFDPNAMTLATVGPNGMPQARVVLLKGFDQRGFCFFTNYNSPKAQQLLQHPQACLVFHWPFPGRQVRITGVVEQLSEQENLAYWKSRLRLSQIGGLASNQSQVIPNRQFLEQKVSELERLYAGKEVPHPKHWGGFRLRPEKFEFWHSGLYRLHDRFEYIQSSDKKNWSIQRLSP